MDEGKKWEKGKYPSSHPMGICRSNQAEEPMPSIQNAGQIPQALPGMCARSSTKRAC